MPWKSISDVQYWIINTNCHVINKNSWQFMMICL